MIKLKSLCVVAAAVVALASCSDEQTTFDLQSVPGRATVQGVVNCNYGATYADGKLQYEIKPVAGLKVLLTISNDKYENGLEGETVLEAITDEEGRYTFDVPVTSKGITGEITTAQFEGKRTIVERKNNEVVTSDQNVVFGTTTPVSVSLTNYAIVYTNVMCEVTSFDQSIDTYGYYATINGTVGRNVERYIAPAPVFDDFDNFMGVNDGHVEYLFEPASSADLIIYVTYGTTEYVLNTTTRADGSFSIEAPVIEFPADLSYRVEVMPVEGTFTTYVANDEQEEYEYEGVTYYVTTMHAETVKGTFAQSSWSTGVESYSFLTAAYSANYEMKGLVFSPYPGADAFGYDAYNWTPASLWVSEYEEENK